MIETDQAGVLLLPLVQRDSSELYLGEVRCQD